MKDNASAVVKSVAAAGCIMLCSAVNADGDIFVGTGETLEYDVASDSVLDVNLTIAPRGTFVKTGEGILTIPTAKIAQGWKANILVKEGGVKITPSPSSSVEADESVPEVMQSAALWFDASLADSFEKNAAGDITAWLDRREAGSAADGYGRIRAVTDNSITNLCPVLRERDGITGLYFQGYGSGCWMNLVKPDDAQATLNSYNVFVIQGQFDKYGPLFGLRTPAWLSPTLAFVPGNASGAFSPMWTYYCLDLPAMHNARTYIDGDEVDAFDSSRQVFPSTRFAMLEVELLKGPGAFQCLFNDRDFWASTSVAGFSANAGDRVGGEYICELVAFTNSLTAAERLQVGRYLMNRWLGAQRPQSVGITVFDGASAELAQASADTETIDVKVSGAGDLVMHGSSGEDAILAVAEDDFFGKVVFEDGSMVMKNSSVFAVSSGGSADVAMPYDGRTITMSDGEAGTFAKTGVGDLRIDHVPSDIRKIDVSGGELSLEAPCRVPSGMIADANVVTGIIPNASFEEGISATTTYKHLGTGGFQGWYSVCGEGGKPNQLAWVNHSTYQGGMNTSSPYWHLPVTVPDGECVLAISMAATVWTTITLPKDGVYALTFKAASRMEATKIGLILELAVGPSADSLTTFGHFRHSSMAGRFTEYRYLLPRLTAGEYQLWFKCVDPTKDKTSLFDDFKLTLVPDEKLYEVPNGSFEEFKGTYDDLPAPSSFVEENFDSLADWTITQSPLTESEISGLKSKSTICYTGSGPILSEMLSTNRTGATRVTPFYNNRESDGGMVQLYLKNGSTASVTFTPVAGRYFVQSDIGLWRCTQDFATDMNASATITVGNSDPIDLGAIGILSDYTLRSRMFPKAFQADGTTRVTLTLRAEINWLSVSQNLTVGQLIFDNVKLVPAADVLSENLVSGGDFSEGGTSREWTSTSWESAASTNGLSPNLVLCSSGSVQAYGANWHDGNKTAVIVDNSRIWQNVTFPETGCHRLGLAARQRVSWGSPTAKKPCPVRFWIARDGVTNEIARFAPCVTNFIMYSWSFDVPEAGEWAFCVEGLGATEEYPGKDMNTLIDDISIVRTPLRSQTPDIPEDIEINVAEGAKLRLDYQGVCTAGRVRINGFSRSGIISAEEFPQAISGEGALYVQPRGTVLTIR